MQVFTTDGQSFVIDAIGVRKSDGMIYLVGRSGATVGTLPEDRVAFIDYGRNDPPKTDADD